MSCESPHLPAFDELTAEDLVRITAGPLCCLDCGGVIELRCGPAPAKSFANRAGRTYRQKPCAGPCGELFTPTGPRDNICSNCRGGPT